MRITLSPSHLSLRLRFDHLTHSAEVRRHRMPAFLRAGDRFQGFFSSGGSTWRPDHGQPQESLGEPPTYSPHLSHSEFELRTPTASGRPLPSTPQHLPACSPSRRWTNAHSSCTRVGFATNSTFWCKTSPPVRHMNAHRSSTAQSVTTFTPFGRPWSVCFSPAGASSEASSNYLGGSAHVSGCTRRAARIRRNGNARAYTANRHTLTSNGNGQRHRPSNPTGFQYAVLTRHLIERRTPRADRYPTRDLFHPHRRPHRAVHR